MSRVDVRVGDSKRQGSDVEELIIQSVRELEFVFDTECTWCDARTTDVLTPSDELPFGSVCVVESNTEVEIKGCQQWVSNGSGRRRGRWYIKRDAHEKLLEENGVYILVVYVPGSDDAIVEIIVVPAAVLGEFLAGSWCETSADWGDASVAKLTWSNLFDPESVERGDHE